MPTGLFQTSSLLLLLSLTSIPPTSPLLVRAAAASSPPPQKRISNPLGLDLSPAPSAEDGPAGAAHALRDPAYLPAQIAGIVGAYAFSLVVVALLLLALSKKRREHLRAAEEIEEVPWDRHQSHVFKFGEQQQQQQQGADLEFSSQQHGEYLQGGHYDEDPPSYRDGVYSIHAPQQQQRAVSHEQPASFGAGHGHVRNFSLPSPTGTKFEVPRFAEAPSVKSFEAQQYQHQNQHQEAPSPSSYFLPSPTSTTRGPLGQDPEVSQDIVQRDRAMAQAELEQMYKYVMEQEEAKEAGVEFRAPMVPAQPRDSTMTSSSSFSNTFNINKKEKKEKFKPANLNLDKPEKKESRTSSILSALKSPGRKKKQMQGISISSPIMTPMSGTFPRYDGGGEEMSAIQPRQYAPAIPPPLPMNNMNQTLNMDHNQASFAARRNMSHIAPLMTPPDMSPESTQSIDERIGNIASVKSKNRAQHGDGEGEVSSGEDEDMEGNDRLGNMPQPHSRHISLATTTNGDNADPVSAVSDTSQSNLLPRHITTNIPDSRASGLPTSPKPGVNRFPSLPSSPKPGATFSRANAPSAVRTGGMLPLRAYENAMMSPTTLQSNRTVKETVFQRNAPMSPGGMHTARTPGTGMTVPYSPYQPFSPVMPITPSLVTKADRKKMRRMEPKTPTLAMVKSDDELW